MSGSPKQNASPGADLERLLEGYPPEVGELALQARALVRDLAEGAVEEFDDSAKMLGFNFIPDTYKGLILTIAPQRNYVNIVFSAGVELLEAGVDDKGLLEGTGKKARHIKVRDAEVLNDPTTRRLIETAVQRTPRD